MRPRVTSLLGLIVLTGACSEDRWIAADPDLPADVAWASTLLFGANGELRGVTALVPRTSIGTFEIELLEPPRDDDQLVTVGWTSEQLEPLFPESLQAVLDAPLRAPRGEDARLPAPAWAVSTAWSAPEDLVEIPSAQVGPLTASWLACPRVVSSRAYVGATCALKPCDAIIEQRGCELVVDTNACVLGTLTMRVDDKGQLTEVTADQLENCQSIEAEPAALSVRCEATLGSCQIDVYDDSPPLAAASIDPIQLVDGSPISLPRPEKDEPGYLFGLALSRGRVMVGVRDVVGTKAGSCPGSISSRVHVFDTDSMETVNTATVAGCVIDLAAAMGGDAILVLHRQGDELRITELDLDGAVLRSAIVAPPRLARGAGLVVDEDRLLLLTSDDQFSESTVLLLDAASLEERASIPIGWPARRIQASKEGAVVLSNDDLAYVDAADEVVRIDTYEVSYAMGTEEGRLLCLALPEACLISGGADERRTELYLKSEGRESEVTAFPERAAQPYGLGHWPEAPWVAVGYTDASSSAQEAFLAAFNPTNLRWRGGTLPIGTGQITDIVVEGPDRIWVALPWTGTLVRVVLAP